MSADRVPADPRDLAGLLMSAATALVSPAPGEAAYHAAGLRVIKGRVPLKRFQRRLGDPQGLLLMVQFGGLCWLGQRNQAPQMNGLVLAVEPKMDPRYRLFLDTVCRVRLNVPDIDDFMVAPLVRPDVAGLVLAPLPDLDARLEGVGDATV